MEDKLPTVLYTYNKYSPKYIHIYEKIFEKMLGIVNYFAYLYCVDEVINIKHKKVMNIYNTISPLILPTFIAIVVIRYAYIKLFRK